MNKVIAVAASLLINLSLVLAFERSANEALPSGEVTVTDLNADLDTALAQASVVSIDADRAVAL
jgi:hypothetical protein